MAKARRLEFTFDKLKLRLGPLPALTLPAGGDAAGFRAGAGGAKDLPFFSFFYVDGAIACARGRSGGLALRARTSPEWELQNGVGLTL